MIQSTDNLIPTPLADMYIEMVLKCQASYTLEFEEGNFLYVEQFQCYQRGGHKDAHKTRLNDYSETGAIIVWNNPKGSETSWIRQIRGE